MHKHEGREAQAQVLAVPVERLNTRYQTERSSCRSRTLPTWLGNRFTNDMSDTEADLLPSDSQVCISMMHARSGMSTKHSKAERRGH